MPSRASSTGWVMALRIDEDIRTTSGHSPANWPGCLRFRGTRVNAGMLVSLGQPYPSFPAVNSHDDGAYLHPLIGASPGLRPWKGMYATSSLTPRRLPVVRRVAAIVDELVSSSGVLAVWIATVVNTAALLHLSRTAAVDPRTEQRRPLELALQRGCGVVGAPEPFYVAAVTSQPFEGALGRVPELDLDFRQDDNGKSPARCGAAGLGQH